MGKKGILSFLCTLLLLLTLAGCGGDEAYVSSPESSATIPFRGVVEDGPIAGAKISLRGKDGTYYPLYDSLGNANYEIRTDANGAFALEVKAGINFSDLRVVAVGGIDRATGSDFSGLEMSTPLRLYNGAVSAIVISPLTTLVAELHDQGFSLKEAEILVRNWLALPPDTNLAAQPSVKEHLDLQLRALLLGKIALEIKTEQPFKLISKEIIKQNTLLWDEDDEVFKQVLSSLGLDDIEIERISTLQNILMDPEKNIDTKNIDTKEKAFYVFKREELLHIFDDNFKEVLEFSSPFDAQQNFNYQKNIEILVEKTLSAAGSEVFLLVDPISSRLFRYVFFTYLVSKPESSDPEERLKQRRERLTLDPYAFPATLTYGETDLKVALENDPWIALLARSSSANSVDSPLLLNELPGDDNQRRLSYYYNSDLSPHFLAEQLIGRVFDDAISDVVLLEIVKGKATAGLIDEARDLIPQIFNNEFKAHAYRAIGDALTSFGRMPEARDDLLLAFDLYRKVIDGPRKASDASRDAISLQDTADAFRKAGYLDEAETVLLYLFQVADKLVSNTSAYGGLLVGTWSVADVYIAAGDLAAATPVVDSLYAYAQKFPPGLTGSVMTYKWHVYYLVETSKRYAALGNRDKVQEIYSRIQDLRTKDGYQDKTGADTWGQLPGLIESLYRVGMAGEALSLANSIPTSYTNALGKITSGVAYRTSAFKLVATYEALLGSLDKAFEYVDTYLPKPEDKVEALTYFASNKGAEYIGMALINADRFEEARSALAKAELFLAGMTEATDSSSYTYLVQRGYVKVADLYVMTGDFNKATELLQQAQVVVSRLVGVKEVVNGLIDIALGYQQIGQLDVTLDLLQYAKSRADEIAVSLVKPEDAALLYEALIKAYLQINDQVHAHGAIVPYLLYARAIHTPGFAYTGTANDDLAAKEVDCLLLAAKYLMSAGYREDALTVLDEAQVTTGWIVVETTRLPKYIYPDPLNPSNKTRYHLVGGYANARAYDQAVDLTLGLADTNSRNQAIEYLADFYISRDDFPDTWVATIDSDGDGKPNFFNPLASAEEIAASGLIMDDDSDGDDIVDALDFRPLYNDRPK